MDLSNELYRNQGVHVDIATFTVDEDIVKVLLVKRKVEPYAGGWILPGGAVYNNESVDFAASRELKEKTGLDHVYIKQFQTFGEPDRDPRMRMVSVGYIALINKNDVSILHDTPKTLDAQWFDLREVPKLEFDHQQILEQAIKRLRRTIKETNIVKDLLPETFTLPKLQKIYEIILDKDLDRRNFRRKFLTLDLIEATGEVENGASRRPGHMYEFKQKEYMEIDIF